ncbi:MAG: hypothetical protein EOP84_13780 [Verrucomicrobiaceae bacterium]|nr:MAG: hypothetical protein EOP84_13780 [Verrucomicrobiaceae bacterium]
MPFPFSRPVELKLVAWLPSFNSTGALTLGNLGADLSKTENYGADWATRPDLFWGVFGVKDTVGSPTLFVSRPRPAPSTPADPWPTQTPTRRAQVAGQINSVIQSGTAGSGSSPSYIQLQATTNSPVAGFQENGAGPSSYNWQVTSNSPTDFGSNTGWSNIEGDFSAGVAATVLDIFRISRVNSVETVALFGTVSISASGVITFTKPSVAPVDKDGDGFTDAEEALAGTSDNDAADFFKVSSLTNSAGSTVLSFNSIASRSYKVYYSEDLSAGSWQLIGTVASSPFTDSDPVRTARQKGFYKVAVTSP